MSLGIVKKTLFGQMRKAISIAILMAFAINSIKAPAYAQAIDSMPAPGVMVHLSPEFTPAILKGIIVHPENPLKFDFVIYKGDKPLSDNAKKIEYTKLIKYFLASLAVPDDDQWVNLSPYEKNRIIKDDFGKTGMGRDLLAQDYMLKQITASLIYPEEKLGQEFWNKVYAKAYKEFGTSNIPVNTFNKVWIVPDNAEVFEKGNMAYCVRNHLKVLLEEDYLSLQKHNGITSNHTDNNKAHAIGSQIVREIVLPTLEKEVNEGKNFALLRQVFSGVVLAAWYKRELKESFLGKVYMNKDRLKGVDQDPRNNQIIYQQYLKAFKKGVFNFIKEDVDRHSNETIPRKYFSGGELVMSSYNEGVRGINSGKPVLVIEPSPTNEQLGDVQGEMGNEDFAQVVADETVKGKDAAMTNLEESILDFNEINKLRAVLKRISKEQKPVIEDFLKEYETKVDSLRIKDKLDFISQSGGPVQNQLLKIRALIIEMHSVQNWIDERYLSSRAQDRKKYSDAEQSWPLGIETQMYAAANSFYISKLQGLMVAVNNMSEVERASKVSSEIVSILNDNSNKGIRNLFNRGNSPGPGLDIDSGGYQAIAKRALEDSSTDRAMKAESTKTETLDEGKRVLEIPINQIPDASWINVVRTRNDQVYKSPGIRLIKRHDGTIVDHTSGFSYDNTLSSINRFPIQGRKVNSQEGDPAAPIVNVSVNNGELVIKLTSNNSDMITVTYTAVSESGEAQEAVRTIQMEQMQILRQFTVAEDKFILRTPTQADLKVDVKQYLEISKGREKFSLPDLGRYYTEPAEQSLKINVPDLKVYYQNIKPIDVAHWLFIQHSIKEEWYSGLYSLTSTSTSKNNVRLNFEFMGKQIANVIVSQSVFDHMQAFLESKSKSNFVQFGIGFIKLATRFKRITNEYREDEAMSTEQAKDVYGLLRALRVLIATFAVSTAITTQATQPGAQFGAFGMIPLVDQNGNIEMNLNVREASAGVESRKLVYDSSKNVLRAAPGVLIQDYGRDLINQRRIEADMVAAAASRDVVDFSDGYGTSKEVAVQLAKDGVVAIEEDGKIDFVGFENIEKMVGPSGYHGRALGGVPIYRAAPKQEGQKVHLVPSTQQSIMFDKKFGTYGIITLMNNAGTKEMDLNVREARAGLKRGALVYNPDKNVLTVAPGVFIQDYGRDLINQRHTEENMVAAAANGDVVDFSDGYGTSKEVAVQLVKDGVVAIGSAGNVDFVGFENIEKMLGSSGYHGRALGGVPIYRVAPKLEPTTQPATPHEQRGAIEKVIPPGGIDVNPANLNLQIKRDGNGVPLPLGQQDMAQLNNLQGLEPTILRIQPASQSSIFSKLIQPIQ